MEAGTTLFLIGVVVGGALQAALTFAAWHLWKVLGASFIASLDTLEDQHESSRLKGLARRQDNENRLRRITDEFAYPRHQPQSQELRHEQTRAAEAAPTGR